MLLQNDTLHVWYAKSHAACQLLTEGGTGWAPGGDLLYSTSKDGGRSWSNTTVKPLLGAPERNTRLENSSHNRLLTCAHSDLSHMTVRCVVAMHAAWSVCL